VVSDVNHFITADRVRALSCTPGAGLPESRGPRLAHSFEASSPVLGRSIGRVAGPGSRSDLTDWGAICSESDWRSRIERHRRVQGIV